MSQVGNDRQRAVDILTARAAENFQRWMDGELDDDEYNRRRFQIQTQRERIERDARLARGEEA
jgi:hypothetical protein